MKKTKDYSKINLDVTTYRNGDTILEVTDPIAWKNLTIGAWCYYNNDPINKKKYGILYNWYAVNDPRGLAPVGYYIPTNEEMNLLNLIHKPTYGGYRNNYGTFFNFGYNGYWWSSSEGDATYAWFRSLNYSYGNASRGYYNKKNGFSVRCLRDTDTLKKEMLKCKDCSDLLEDCTCIADTLDMKKIIIKDNIFKRIFGKLLLLFINDINTGCIINEEEKNIIIFQCNQKLIKWKTFLKK